MSKSSISHNFSNKKANILQEIATYNQDVMVILNNLIQEIATETPPPCQFSILALGSSARGEMLPGSDFEFAVLLDQKFVPNSDIDTYFTKFTRNLEKKLKEHNIPIDTAGTHPIGDKEKNRLIGNKNQLLLFQHKDFHKFREETHKDNPYLFTILGTSSLLHATTDKMRVEYENYLSGISGNTNEERLNQIAHSLRDSLSKHIPLHSRVGHESESRFNPKYDFYRIPNLILDHLDLYYGLEYRAEENRTAPIRLNKLANETGSHLIKDRKDKIESSYQTAMYLRMIIPKIYAQDGQIDLKELDLKNFILSEQQQDNCRRLFDVTSDHNITQFTKTHLTELTNDLYTNLREIYDATLIFTEDHKLDKIESPYRKGCEFKAKGDYEEAYKEFDQNAKVNFDHYYSHHRKAQIELKLVTDPKTSKVDPERLKAALKTLENAEQIAVRSGIEALIKNHRKRAVILENLVAQTPNTEKKRELQNQAKDQYFEALESSLSQTFRASSHSPKIMLIKILMGLSRLELTNDDKIKYNRIISLTAGIKLDDVKEVLNHNRLDENEANLKEQTTKISKAICGLIADKEIRNQVETKYIEPSKSEQPTNSTKTISNIESIESFIGREDELNNIDEELSKSKYGVITSGAGGIGKTSLAKEYATRELKKYENSVLNGNESKHGARLSFFLNIKGQRDNDSTTNLDTSFRGIADTVNSEIEKGNLSNIKKITDIAGDEKNEDKQNRIRKEVYEILESLNRKYILIFDDARDYNSIKNYLPKNSNNAQILITSRDSNKNQWEKENIKQIGLKVFSTNISISYLLENLTPNLKEKYNISSNHYELTTQVNNFLEAKPSENERKELSEIQTLKPIFESAHNLANKLHYYPLALSHASKYMEDFSSQEDKNIFDEYSDLFGAESYMIYGTELVNYNETMARTLDLSLGLLKNPSVANVGSNQASRIKEAAEIHYKLLMTLTMVHNDDLYTNSIAKCLKQNYNENKELTEAEIKNAIKSLMKHSFITEITPKSQYRATLGVNYEMHDMVREELKRNLKEISLDLYGEYWIKALDALNEDKEWNRKYQKIDWAIKQNDLEICKWLVEKKIVNVNARNKAMETPLHIAVCSKNLEICKWLEGKGINLNAQSQSLRTPLHYAIILRDLKTCKWLIEKGADIEAKAQGHKTPLHYAAEDGQLELCKFLIKEGANVNAESKYQGTALLLAVKSQNLELCKYFVEEIKLDVNARSSYNETPLCFAVGLTNLELCKYLVKKGADVNVESDFRKTLLLAAKARPSKIEGNNKEVYTYISEQIKKSESENFLKAIRAEMGLPPRKPKSLTSLKDPTKEQVIQPNSITKNYHDDYNKVTQESNLTHQNIISLIEDTFNLTTENQSPTSFAVISDNDIDRASLDKYLYTEILKFIGEKQGKISIALCQGHIDQETREITGNTHWTALHLQKIVNNNGTTSIQPYHLNSFGDLIPVPVTDILKSITEVSQEDLSQFLPKETNQEIIFKNLEITNFEECQVVPSIQQTNIHDCGYHAVFNMLKVHQADDVEALPETITQNGVEVSIKDFITNKRQLLQDSFNNTDNRLNKNTPSTSPSTSTSKKITTTILHNRARRYFSDFCNK